MCAGWGPDPPPPSAPAPSGPRLPCRLPAEGGAATVHSGKRVSRPDASGNRRTQAERGLRAARYEVFGKGSDSAATGSPYRNSPAHDRPVSGRARPRTRRMPTAHSTETKPCRRDLPGHAIDGHRERRQATQAAGQQKGDARHTQGPDGAFERAAQEKGEGAEGGPPAPNSGELGKKRSRRSSVGALLAAPSCPVLSSPAPQNWGGEASPAPPAPARRHSAGTGRPAARAGPPRPSRKSRTARPLRERCRRFPPRVSRPQPSVHNPAARAVHRARVRARLYRGRRAISAASPADRADAEVRADAAHEASCQGISTHRGDKEAWKKSRRLPRIWDT